VSDLHSLRHKLLLSGWMGGLIDNKPNPLSTKIFHKGIPSRFDVSRILETWKFHQERGQTFWPGKYHEQGSSLVYERVVSETRT
jgi:hypothetical protein